VNQSHVRKILVFNEMVERFVNVLFVYFILYIIVTHKFHNFYVYLLTNHIILKLFSYSELVNLNDFALLLTSSQSADFQIKLNNT
jgi:hypothetical protein